MLKISSALALVCMLSATSAMAATLVNTKTAVTSLQQVKFITPKNMAGSIGVAGTSFNPLRHTLMRDKAVLNNDSVESMTTTTQVGLLATALLCFVARSSRRKV